MHSVFLTMHQTVDLAALKVFAGLLIGLFCFFFFLLLMVKVLLCHGSKNSFNS